MSEHIERLNRHIADGTLIRGSWKGTDAQGRETARLLAAMAPACGANGSASVCPADIMPSWLAYLTPSLDDNGSIEAWPGMVQRFADLASRWHVLDAAAWQRVQFGWLAVVVREAASHTQSESAQAVCGRVVTLCEGVVVTGVIDAAAFDDARKAAWDTWASASSAARAAWASAEAASAEAAWATAEAAAAEAARAARAPEAARAASEAWDRLTVALFDAIERELG